MGRHPKHYVIRLTIFLRFAYFLNRHVDGVLARAHSWLASPIAPPGAGGLGAEQLLEWKEPAPEAGEQACRPEMGER